jgi:hypothetical protein
MKIKPRIVGALVCALLAGVLVGWGLPNNPEDPCRDLATISTTVMGINTDIMNATTEFLNADSAGDSVAMVTASNKLSTAVSDLDALKPRYTAADSKCNV